MATQYLTLGSITNAIAFDDASYSPLQYSGASENDTLLADSDGNFASSSTIWDDLQTLKNLDDMAALSKTDGGFIVGDGTDWVLETGATARTSLGLGSISTQDASSVTVTDLTVTGAFIPRHINSATPDADEAGTTDEVALNENDNKLYWCTSGGTAGSATWQVL